MKVILFTLLVTAGAAQTPDKNYLLGKFEPAADGRFSKLNSEHTGGSARGGVLRTEAYDAFIRMAAAAQKEGVHLVIISATRNFESQKTIWENKWNGKVMVGGKNLSLVKDPKERATIILKYSSMPGSSRHHWGTDMDLNSLENSYFESGQGLKLYQWLTAHGGEYGFCQPYTSKEKGRTGYEEEKWHWSYRPLSASLLQDYLKQIHYSDFGGFAGASAAAEIKVIENYVAGVACSE